MLQCIDKVQIGQIIQRIMILKDLKQWLTFGVAFQTNEIDSYFMLSNFGLCNIKILGRFECNLGNTSFLEE